MAGLVAIPAQAGAATAIVTSCDGSAATPGSLPNLVANAAAGETITFSVTCPRSSPVKLTAAMNIGVSLTIAGPGPSKLAVSGRSAVRVFTIANGVTATISGLTIEHAKTNGLGAAIKNAGNLTLNHTTVTSSTSLHGGGGVYTTGPLTVTNSTFSGNTVCPTQCSKPSGEYTTFAGGGIDGPHSTLSVTHSTFSGNSAPYGAGLWAGTGGLTMTSSILTGNTASWEGGGIFLYGGTITNSTVSGNSAGHWGGGMAGDNATVTGSTLAGNTAPNGAGFWGAGLTLTNSTATRNTASADGGVFGGSDVTVSGSTLTGNGAGLGGAIWVQGGGIDVTDSTLATNTATGQDGAIYYQPGSSQPAATVTHTTIWGNTAPPGGAAACS